MLGESSGTRILRNMGVAARLMENGGRAPRIVKCQILKIFHLAYLKIVAKNTKVQLKLAFNVLRLILNMINNLIGNSLKSTSKPMERIPSQVANAQTNKMNQAQKKLIIISDALT